MKQNNKQTIYNAWHKNLYQTNIASAIQRQKYLNKTIIRYLNITEETKGKLLDVACGKGIFLHEVRNRNKYLALYGSDISDVAIKDAKKIVNATFSVDDGEDLSLPNNFFDYVVSSGGLEYYDDAIQGVKEIRRVLKKNGTAIFFVPNLMFIGYIWLAMRHGSMPTHGGEDKKGKKVYDYNVETFYSRKGWIDILTDGGLEIVTTHRYEHLGSTRHANDFLLKLYDLLLHKIIPQNLAYSFVFVCKKNNKINMHKRKHER